jgi:broad specificity phosphatase PhoE
MPLFYYTMSLLTLVRHGQAAYMQEDYDRLSPLGEEQSRKLGNYFARHGIPVDRVFCGPAKRHARTVSIVADAVRNAGNEWPAEQVIPDFDEFDAFKVMKVVVPEMSRRDPVIGALSQEFQAKRHLPEAGRILQKLFEEVCRRWCGGDYDTPNVETWAQFRQRITAAVERLRASAEPSSHTLVITSGGPIAATVAYALDLPHQKAIEFVWLSRNCSYAQFLFSGDRFSMHAFNAIPHLDDLSLLTYR